MHTLFSWVGEPAGRCMPDFLYYWAAHLLAGCCLPNFLSHWASTQQAAACLSYWAAAHLLPGSCLPDSSITLDYCPSISVSRPLPASLVSPPSLLQARETSGNTVNNFMATCHVMIKSLTHCMTS